MAQGVPAQEASRRAVRASLQVALEASFSRCGFVWIYSSFALIMGLLGLMAWSWIVYQDHYRDQCDQPLALMLKIFYFMVCIYALKKEILGCCLCYDPVRDPVEPCRVRLLMRLLYTGTLLWPVVALVMLSQIKTCSSELKTVVQVITGYYAVAALVVVALPACTISIMLCLIRRGYIREQRDSAPENFIEQLPIVEYEPSLFDDDSGCYATSCSICLDSFDAEQVISRTTCGEHGHAFHRTCLDGWLQFSRTCPLCRTDVTENSA